MHWSAIYTRSRNEKKIAERLKASGIEVYCPTQTTLRQWSDRKKKVTEPVFKSYVFVQYKNEEERLKVLQTSGVVNYVKYLGKVAQIPDREIAAIQHFLEGNENVEVKDIASGDEVSIHSGALKGKSGIVEHTDGTTATLYIDALGLQLHAQVKSQYLSKLRDADKIEQKSKFKL